MNYKEHIEKFWAEVDWTKTNLEISIETGVPEYSIRRTRLIRTGKSNAPLSKSKAVDWTLIDWSKNNQVLSKELGINVNTINHHRARLHKGMPSKKSYQFKITPEQIQSIDWEFETDMEISRRFSVSRERIRQIRNEKQLPACRVKGTRTMNGSLLRYILKNEDRFKDMSLEEAYNAIPDSEKGACSRDNIFRQLLKSKLQFKQRAFVKYRAFDYSKIDWRLPNKAISLIWKMPTYRLAIERSKYLHLGREKMWKMGGFSKQAHDPELLAAIQAELRKAIAEGTDNTAEVMDWLRWRQENSKPLESK